MFDSGAEGGWGWGWRWRRDALNEALHEVRRPLQALALAPAMRQGAGELDGSLRMATEALERLDRLVNGGTTRTRCEPFHLRPLLDEALARWRPRAELAGRSLALCWRGHEPVLIGDRAEIASAVDNLIVNALEHGGRRILVTVSAVDNAVRFVVADSGGQSARPNRRRRDRRRHGHGLRVARRVAAAHGGRFELRRTGPGAEAVLELPLWDGGGVR